MINSDLPFTGGWFVYLSYELIGQIECLLKTDLSPSTQPIAIAVKIPTAIIIDHLCEKTYLLDQFDNQQRIDQVLTDIAQLEDIPLAPIQGELFLEEQPYLPALR